MESTKRIRKEYRQKFYGLSRNFPGMKPDEVRAFMGLTEEELYKAEEAVKEKNSRGRRKRQKE